MYGQCARYNRNFTAAPKCIRCDLHLQLENVKTVTTANFRPPDVAPVILDFNY